MTEPTLKPCPFCNSEHIKAVEDSYPKIYFVTCRDCDAAGPAIRSSEHWSKWDLLTAAEKAWNRNRRNPDHELEIKVSLDELEAATKGMVDEILAEPEAEQDQKSDLNEDPPKKAESSPQPEPATVDGPPQVDESSGAEGESSPPERHPIAERIEAYLKREGLTVYTTDLGVNPQSIKNILVGTTKKPTAKTLDKITKRLDKLRAIDLPTEHKSPPPITAPKLNNIKNTKQAAKFFTAAVNDWIESERIDPVTAAEILQVNQKVFANIRLHKGGHLPHSNIITAFARHIPAIHNNSGALLASRRQLDQAEK